MRAVLQEIGYADALLAREDENGQLILIDGHLRADVTPSQDIPVLIVDVTAAETKSWRLWTHWRAWPNSTLTLGRP
jgi:hypothetical protein